MPGGFQRFLSELSRRRVMRVVATYAIGTFGALQSADVIVSALGLPHYLMTGLVVLTFVGLPVTAALAWVFDLTPEGVVRTLPLPEAGAPAMVGTPTIPSAPPRRSRLALLLGACALLLGLAGASLWWQARHKPPLANDLVAVLPFSVGGSEQYQYLRAGMAELFSTGIVGGGALRTVDQRALARAIKDSGGDPDDEAGRGLARRFGAGLFLVGSVLEVKDRLRVHVQLYDANEGARPLADASTEGEAGQLFSMVDELLGKLRPGLLASGRAAASEPLVALAESTTKSLPALKAFIEGEGALRDGDLKSAFQSLQKAVAEDPDFALAQYRLAVVASWSNEIPLGRAALYRALRGREKLPPRERELIEAFAAYWRGHAKEAEQRYRKILEHNPDDAESWYQLGEVLFHDGPLQGRPEAEARSCFEKAAALEPNQRMYSIHVDQLARLAGDRAALAKLDELQLKSTPEAMAVPLHWEIAWAKGDEAQRSELEKKLADPYSLLSAAVLAENHSPNAEGLEEARTLADRASALPGLTKELRLSLRLFQSQLDYAGGKRKEGDAIIAAEVKDEPMLLHTVAMRALIPFVPHQPAELRSALESLPPESFMPYAVHSPNEARQVHGYISGRLLAQLGDAAGAEAAAQQLATTNDSDDSALGADLALAVRAHAAAAQGKSAEALALLEQQSGGAPLAVIGQPYLGGEGERWLHASLLSQAGRFDEALRWFESVQANGVSTWAGPLHLRRSELLERLGRKQEALEQARLFAELWADADPELRPQVEGARQRIAALAREQAR